MAFDYGSYRSMSIRTIIHRVTNAPRARVRAFRIWAAPHDTEPAFIYVKIAIKTFRKLLFYFSAIKLVRHVPIPIPIA